MPARYDNFRDFYPFYLSEHSNLTCRRLHFFGAWLVLATLAFAVFTATWWALVLLPIFGYGLAWIGHFVFEKNKPASFKQPFYSFLGDWTMFKDILIGKVKI